MILCILNFIRINKEMCFMDYLADPVIYRPKEVKQILNIRKG